MASGSGKATADPEQNLSISAQGSGYFEQPVAKKMFLGTNAMPLHMTCDGPKFSTGGDLFQIKDISGKLFGGSVIYTYLPALPQFPPPK